MNRSMQPLHPSVTRRMAGLYGLDDSKNSEVCLLLVLKFYGGLERTAPAFASLARLHALHPEL